MSTPGFVFAQQKSERSSVGSPGGDWRLQRDSHTRESRRESHESLTFMTLDLHERNRG